MLAIHGTKSFALILPGGEGEGQEFERADELRLSAAPAVAVGGGGISARPLTSSGRPARLPVGPHGAER